MKRTTLNGNWFLSNDTYQKLPAVVPGCVHTDLKRNGIIPDYFWRDNNDSCQWIEREDWSYSRFFDAENTAESCRLVFEGLDTYATVLLNGDVLGETQNMFIPHAFDVSGKLKEKDNLLEVRFRSPVKETENLPARPGAFTTERMYTRRMQCTYYWDWVDRFVTCGIFLPVYLETGDDFCVGDAYIYTEAIDDFGAQIVIETNYLNHEKSGVVQFEIFDPNGQRIHENKQYAREPKTVQRVNVTAPQLWWPNGYGEHPLYTLRITANENIHEETFGIRTLRVAEIPDAKDSDYRALCRKLQDVQRTPIEEFGWERQDGQRTLIDEFGWDDTEETAGFVVIVNGKRIYCRGGNWVPCDPFPSEESEEKIAEIVALAAEGNMNMIRVWGGGLFEKDCFYGECDKRGILVTQDFLMACGEYPQKETWFLEELAKEAAFAAKKLRNHPCLAWWSGDNENATKGFDLGEEYNGRDAALVGTAPSIFALDPNRRFHLSSPYGGTPYMSITRGTTHTTNFFGDMFQFFTNTDCVSYKEHLEHFLARFTVEEPIYGTPQKCSLLKFLTEEDLADESERILRFHSKTNPCVNPTLFDYGKTFAEKIFGGFHGVEDKLFKYEYLQYEWIRVIFENCRRHTGFNDGLVFWMLNDCWPASMSWSIIDFYNLPKAAWYSFKRCAKSVIGSVKKENGTYHLYLSSDGKSGVAKVVCHTLAQQGVYETEVSIDGYGVTVLKLPFDGQEPFVICDVHFEDTVDRCFYKEGSLPLEKSDRFEVLRQDEQSITVRGTAYLHAVVLEGEYIFSDNYFSLLPGEEKTITYRKATGNAAPALPRATAFTLTK